MNKYNFLKLQPVYKRSTVYQNIPDIIELIAPLRAKGLWYFAAGKINANNELSLFVSDNRVFECYVKNPELFYEEPHFLPSKLLHPGIYYSNKVFPKVYPYTTFPHFKTFTTIKDYENGEREIFLFATDTENFNNYELLKAFIPEFKDKANKLITKADSIFLPIIHPEANPMNALKQISSLGLYSDSSKNFITKNDYNYCKSLQVATMHNLSHREAQCLNLILQGNLNKQIADILDLSQKTTEAYVDKLKNKLGCRTKNDLVIKALSFDVTESWMKSIPIIKDINNMLEDLALNKDDKCLKIAQQYRLSLRETQCLDLMLQGKLDKQISAILNLSEKTIEAYIGNIKNKLRCRTKIEVLLKVLS